VTTSGATYTDAVLTAELADIGSAAYSLLAPNSTPSETHRNAVHTNKPSNFMLSLPKTATVAEEIMIELQQQRTHFYQLHQLN